MTKQILDIGSCGPDHSSLTQLVCDNFDATVDQAHGMADALETLRGGNYNLITVNRLMDRDGSEGIEIIKAIKSDSVMSDIPVMMITNYKEHQDQAIDAGATPGFGKAQISSPHTIELLRPFLA